MDPSAGIAKARLLSSLESDAEIKPLAHSASGSSLVGEMVAVEGMITTADKAKASAALLLGSASSHSLRPPSVGAQRAESTSSLRFSTSPTRGGTTLVWLPRDRRTPSGGTAKDVDLHLGAESPDLEGVIKKSQETLTAVALEVENLEIDTLKFDKHGIVDAQQLIPLRAALTILIARIEESINQLAPIRSAVSSTALTSFFALRARAVIWLEYFSSESTATRYTSIPHGTIVAAKGLPGDPKRRLSC